MAVSVILKLSLWTLSHNLASNAYPKAIYEGMMNMRHGHKMLDIAKDAQKDKKVQRYLREEVTRLIKDLKIK